MSRRAVLVLTVVVQLVVLYWPRSPSTGGLPVDKVVHATVFGAVLVAAARVPLDLRVVTAALAAHAVLSELVQHLVLPHRSGDWTDTVADLAGVALALLAVRWFGRAPRREPAATATAAPGRASRIDPR